MNYIMLLENIYILIEMFFVAKTDYKKKIIPNMSVIRILCTGALCLALRLIFYNTPKFAEIIEASLGFLFAGLLFLITKIVSKDSVGMGDVKLMFALGFYFGLYKVIAVLIVTLVVMSLHSIIRLALKKVQLREEVAFAPYVFIGVLATILLQI